MVTISEDELKRYREGEVQIENKPDNFFYIGGIGNLRIDEENVLHFRLLWAIKLTNCSGGVSTWIHVNLPIYSIDLNSCDTLNLKPSKKSSVKTLGLYSNETKDSVIVRIANMATIFKENLMEMENCPPTLSGKLRLAEEYAICKVDLEKIPKVNFELKQISGSNNPCNFLRFDLRLFTQNRTVIRIGKNSTEPHLCIYDNFLDEVAEQFSLSRGNVNFVHSSDADIGYFLYTEEDGLTVYSDRNLPENLELTKRLIKEELNLSQIRGKFIDSKIKR